MTNTDFMLKIASHLIGGFRSTDSQEQNQSWLDGDSVALIVAGRHVDLCHP